MMRFLALLLLLVFPSISSAALECEWGTTSPSAACSYFGQAVRGGKSMSAGNFTQYSTGIGYTCYQQPENVPDYGGYCSGSCDAPLVFNQLTGQCEQGEEEHDDCSTNVGTNGLDMSGSTTDGSCICPSGKNFDTATSACIDPPPPPPPDNQPCGSIKTGGSSDAECTCAAGQSKITDYEGVSYCSQKTGGNPPAGNQGSCGEGQSVECTQSGDSVTCGCGDTPTPPPPGSSNPATGNDIQQQGQNIINNNIRNSNNVSNAVAASGNAVSNAVAGGSAGVTSAVKELSDKLEDKGGAPIAGVELDADGYSKAKASAMAAWNSMGNAPIMQAMSNTFGSFPTGSSSCPALGFSMWGREISTTMHCTLFEQVAPALSTVFYAAWAILAVFVFRRM